MRRIASLVIILASGFFLMAPSCSKEDAKKFESTLGWEKLDLRMQSAWHGAVAENATTRFETIIKTTHILNPAEKKQLAKAGFEARTFIGAIITGSMKGDAVPKVANLPFLKVIEFSTPVTTKGK